MDKMLPQWIRFKITHVGNKLGGACPIPFLLPHLHLSTLTIFINFSFVFPVILFTSIYFIIDTTRVQPTLPFLSTEQFARSGAV